jgi:hypothetical protein
MHYEEIARSFHILCMKVYSNKSHNKRMMISSTDRSQKKTTSLAEESRGKGECKPGEKQGIGTAGYLAFSRKQKPPSR